MKLVIACFFAFSSALVRPGQDSSAKPQKRLEELREKTILVFTPHPDDDVFGAGGTSMA